MTFRDKLRELRSRAGLTEQQLADKAGLQFGTVHRYAMGRSQPTLAAAAKLSAALGVDCTAFSGCDDVAGDGVAAKPRRSPAKGKFGRKKK